MPEKKRSHSGLYVLAYYGILLFVGLLAAFLGPALPSLAKASGSSLSQASFMLSCRPFGYMLGTLSFGRILDRRAGHPLMALALLSAGLFLLLAASSQSLPFLCLFILGLGFADGVLDVGCNTLLPWIFGDKAGPYFNGLHFCFGIGALAAPLLVAKALSAQARIAPALWIMAALALPLALGLGFLPSPRRRLADGADSPGGISRHLGLLVGLCFLSYGASETALGAWLYSYALKLGLSDSSGAAALSSLFWGMLTLGRFLAIPLALRVPLSKLLVVDAIGSVLSLALILAMPQSSKALWLGCAGAGLFMASFFPSLLGFCAQKLSPSGHLSGSLTSFFFVCSSSGAMLLPWLIGQGFERLGAGIAPWSICISLSCMGLLLWRILRRATISRPLQSA